MSETKTAEEYFTKQMYDSVSGSRASYIIAIEEYANQQNQELQSKMFTWEKDYLDLQLRNQELKKQLQQLKEDASYINGTMGDMLGEHKELNDGLQRQVDERNKQIDGLHIVKSELQRQVEELKENLEKKEILLTYKINSSRQWSNSAMKSHHEMRKLQSQYTQLKDAADEMYNCFASGNLEKIEKALITYKQLNK